MGNIFSRIVICDPGGSLPVRTVTDIIPTDGSRLIVDPGTTACFNCNGKYALYPPGTHILNTGLSPLFLQLSNWKTGGKAPISACVYYVSTEQEFICSISSGEIAFRERTFSLALKAQCQACLRYRIKSPLRFLQRVVGMNRNTITAADLNLQLQQLLIPQIRSQLGKRLSNCDVADLTDDLHPLSRELSAAIASELDQYGLRGALIIQSIDIPQPQLECVLELEHEQVQNHLRLEAEKHSIKDIYGSLDKRTQVELLTGVSRMPPIPGQIAPSTPIGNSNASMLASLPIQMAMLQQLMSNQNIFTPNSPVPTSDDPFSWADSLSIPGTARKPLLPPSVPGKSVP